MRAGGEAISITYSYDADGNRVSKTENTVTTKYINDPNQPLVQVLQERDSNDDTIASYTYGNDLISQTRSSTTSYYLYDGLGSTRVLTDSSGDILNTYNYDAFGNTIAVSGTSPNNYRFTGEQTDGDSGLYYLRARYYDPAVGRFISRDPIGYMGGMNLYAYCENDPVNRIDPLGLEAVAAIGFGRENAPGYKGNTYSECMKAENEWYQKNLRWCSHTWVNWWTARCVEQCMGYDTGGWSGSNRSGQKGWYSDGSVWVKKGGIYEQSQAWVKHCESLPGGKCSK